MILQRGVHAMSDMLHETKPSLKIDTTHCDGFLKDFNRSQQMSDAVKKEIQDGEDLLSTTNRKNQLRPELVVSLKSFYYLIIINAKMSVWSFLIYAAIRDNFILPEDFTKLSMAELNDRRREQRRKLLTYVSKLDEAVFYK